MWEGHGIRTLKTLALCVCTQPCGYGLCPVSGETKCELVPELRGR